MDFKTSQPGGQPQPRPESWWARMDVTIDDFVEVAQIALLVICLITMVRPDCSFDSASNGFLRHARRSLRGASGTFIACNPEVPKLSEEPMVSCLRLPVTYSSIYAQ